jgi:phage-related protein
MADPSSPKAAAVVWEGNSREVIRMFPRDVREDFGEALRAMQHGDRPTCPTRPMQSVGRGVFELKTQDRRTWYRTLYLSRIGDVIHDLHCFEKSSRKTPKSDIELAARRLSEVHERLERENKNEKQTHKA